MAHKNSKMPEVKPFLKWVGGKTQIIDKVLGKFPDEIINYYEPFLGGGSVLLALLSSNIKIIGTVYASDINSNLIALYKNIQSDPDTFIEEVNKLSSEFAKCSNTGVNRTPLTIEEALTSPESYYFWIRRRFNAFTKEERTSVVASAMLLFMNKTCFRGVYREGPRGFNVPFGNYAKPSILDEAHIKLVSNLIKDVIFTTASFEDALRTVETGDFVYLDPPYAPENDKSFVSYTADGFNLEMHTTLFELCSKMNSDGVQILMSNADVDLVKDAFPSPAFTKTVVVCRRAINSKKPESKTNEVLIESSA